jgi:hypothetical protein
MNTAACHHETATDLIVRTAFRHRIIEPNVESGFSRFAELTDHVLKEAEFHKAVFDCLARRLIHDPVRLGEGALQCHWHLELTPAGVGVARALAAGTPRVSE